MLIASLSAGAEIVSPGQALAIARQTQGMHRAPAQDSHMSLAMTIDNQDMPAVYVFSAAGDRGFLITAADDNVSPIVLGYADSGSIDTANMPQQMRWLLAQYARSTAFMAENPLKATRTAIAPLVKTQWDQLAPYNDLCPTLDGQSQKPPTGCVATAMAQIMKFYDYPTKGQGSYTNSFTYNGKTYTQTANFGSTTYDWANMTDTYTSASTTAQKTAVATLMRDCGVAARMQYAPTGSGASDLYATMGMINYFNYNKAAKFEMYQWYTTDEWSDLVYNEIAAGRPVMFAGVDEDGGGHEFILDGCDTKGYFHVNWGWSGIADGYYAVTNLAPDYEGTGSGSGDEGYNYSQSIITNLQPAVSGASYVPEIFTEKFDTNQTVYTRDRYTYVTFDGAYYSSAFASFNYDLGLAMESTNGIDYLDFNHTITIRPFEGFGVPEIPSTFFPVGSYDVYQVYKTSTTSGWQRVKYDKTQTAGHVHMDVTSTQIKVTRIAEGTLKADAITLSDVLSGAGTRSNPYILGKKDFSVSADLRSEDGYWQGTVQGAIAPNGQSASVAETEIIDVDLDTNGTTHITFPGPFTGLEVGTLYRFAIVTGTGKLVGSMQYFQIDPKAAVTEIGADSSAAEYFTIDGIRVQEPSAPGLYIRRTGSKAEKILIK